MMLPKVLLVLILNLLGYGTTHKVNNLIIQKREGSFSNAPTRKSNSPKRKRGRRSFKPIKETHDIEYRQTKRIGPPTAEFVENEASALLMDDVNQRHFLWCLMRHNDSVPYTIPSWTGFQISICNKLPILKSNIAYLDCIDAPATQMSTIYQVTLFNIQAEI